jgi:hypothetical protein
MTTHARRCVAAAYSAGVIPASQRTVKVPAEDAVGKKKNAGTMLRAPMSLEKMTYDAATSTVI